MSLNSVKKQKPSVEHQNLFIENNQKSGNKGYNRYIPGDSSQLRQLHMSLTLSVSLFINDALAFPPDSGLPADDS